MPYQVLSQRWRDFYVVAGTSTATLVGLLFVGLSLHLRAVLSRSEVRGLARVTLANFGLLLFASLFLMVPEGRTAAGTQLLVSGLISLALIAPSLVATARSETRTLGAAKVLLRVGTSAVAYVGVAAAGALLIAGSASTAFDWMLAVTVLLVFISLRNSWDLLVSVGAATLDEGT